MELSLPFGLTMDGSSQRSVFIRTLLRYLTLTLRHAPTCHGNGREPDELTEHHRTGSLQRTALLPFIPFCVVMNKEVRTSTTWILWDLNPGPSGYEPDALTN